MKLLDLFDKDPDNQSGCSDILMKCLFSFIITYLLLLALSFIDYSEESQNWMSVALLIVYPIVCFFTPSLVIIAITNPIHKFLNAILN